MIMRIKAPIIMKIVCIKSVQITAEAPPPIVNKAARTSKSPIEK
jgi:hypothetical protein